MEMKGRVHVVYRRSAIKREPGQKKEDLHNEGKTSAYAVIGKTGASVYVCGRAGVRVCARVCVRVSSFGSLLSLLCGWAMTSIRQGTSVVVMRTHRRWSRALGGREIQASGIPAAIPSPGIAYDSY